MTEAASALIEHAFGARNMRRIERISTRPMLARRDFSNGLDWSAKDCFNVIIERTRPALPANRRT